MVSLSATVRERTLIFIFQVFETGNTLLLMTMLMVQPKCCCVYPKLNARCIGHVLYIILPIIYIVIIKIMIYIYVT